jgi:hypothetical protein
MKLHLLWLVGRTKETRTSPPTKARMKSKRIDIDMSQCERSASGGFEIADGDAR